MKEMVENIGCYLQNITTLVNDSWACSMLKIKFILNK